jgi:RTX calcium-binding nonapeptide repeat (4 copies)
MKLRVEARLSLLLWRPGKLLSVLVDRTLRKSKHLKSSKVRSSLILALPLCAALVSLVVERNLVQAGGPVGSTCTYAAGVVRVEMSRNNAHGTLDRDRSGIIYYYDHNSTREPCGGATVLSTERIVVEDTQRGAGTAFFLDVSKGSFGHNGREIPMRIDLGPSGYDSFIVEGGRKNDTWTFGKSRANLQRDQAAEIDFANPPDIASASSAGGHDRVCADGRRGTGRASGVPWAIEGGDAPDRLCGGREEDHVLGGNGHDVMRGKGSTDVLTGGAGRDRVLGNAKDDFLEGNEGVDELRGGAGGDAFNGGSGFDSCNGTAREFERNCES